MPAPSGVTVHRATTTRGWLRSLLVAGMLALGLGTARAAAPEQVTLSQSAAQRCLSPAEPERAKPEYPEDDLRRKERAWVDAEFTFGGPESAPEVRFTTDTVGDFRASIVAYARQLRVPCMAKGGQPITLKQHFDFIPNDGRKVAWTAPVEPLDARRLEQLKCEVSDDSLRPPYPPAMLRANREGTVVARVRFVAPDQPPQVEFLDNGGSGYFADAVSPYLASMRIPCLQGEPVEAMFHYRFVIEGNSKKVLNDLDLRSFVATVKKVPAGSAYFDTQSMKCPFDVRLTFQQPWEPNRIEELEEDVPARHAFLDWMSQRQFDLPVRAANALLGQQMVVHIPCAVLDL